MYRQLKFIFATRELKNYLRQILRFNPNCFLVMCNEVSMMAMPAQYF